jgi:UDP-MurNAc hydroxylase
MKFQVLSHAGLTVEHNGICVLIDPWLLGSCYWRSWWNFPEPSRELIDSIKPDFIYITHLHWDHFHGPSLRLFDKATPFLIPKIPTRRMVKDLNVLGFKNIIEIPHGAKFSLSNDFHLYSYQFGFSSDSAIVLESRDTTLLNANDTKFFGRPLRQIKKRHKRFDFVLRSYSSASALPYCIEDYKTHFPVLRTREDYIAEFTAFALSIKAKYAIPFASNHCFLHEETIKFNETSVSPESVAEFYRKETQRLNIQSECVVMPAGSSWQQDTGFHQVKIDYTEKNQYINELLLKYDEKLKKQYILEQNAVFNAARFKNYFSDFLNSLPWIFRKLFRKRILFKIPDKTTTHQLLLDFYNNTVEEYKENERLPIEIECHATIINACTAKKMFSVWGASKRLKVYCREDNLKTLNIFFLLLEGYELDLLPIAKNFSVRHLSIYLRRWREFLEFIRVVMILKISKRPFSLANEFVGSSK